jgi:rare lipoprotein A
MSAKGGAKGNGRRSLWQLAVLAAVALILSGCASSEPRVASGRYRAGHPSYKVGAPYQINGVWYRPKVDYDYDETGVGSWYGEAFDQQLTANGEIFDLNELTAAHRTLPLPSIVEVTNLQNGRQLKLRVNDRGPYAQNRIIDVSRRAAQLLGFERSGTTPVHVQIVKDESIKVAEAAKRGSTGDVVLAAAAATMPVATPPPPRPAPERSIAVAELPPPQRPPAQLAEAAAIQAVPAAIPPGTAIEPPAPRSWLIASAHAETLPPSPVRLAAAPSTQSDRVITTSGSSRIFIQAGAFAVPENAQRARSRFSALANVEVANIAAHGSPLYRVRLGPVATAEEADRLLSRLVSSGYPDARIVKE